MFIIITLMWQYIVAVLVISISLIFLWILQPYRVWLKAKSTTSSTQNKLVIKDPKQRSFTLKQHLDQKAKNPKIKLSLVVPSYNEEKRLPKMLNESINYLKEIKIQYEIIVVNDGSKDRTTAVAIQKGKEMNANLYVVEYPKNRGKGGAVRAGMAVAVGERILMVDADGATTFTQLQNMMTKMNQIQQKVKHPLIMVVGSRKHLEEVSKVQRKFHRLIVSGVFGFVKSIICGVKTQDTQCGFKLFTLESAKKLFNVIHIQRWAFDIQLFVLCTIFGIQVGEVPVEWKDVDGSKLNVIEASVNMFRDLLMIRLLYLIGLWKTSDRVIVQ